MSEFYPAPTWDKMSSCIKEELEECFTCIRLEAEYAVRSWRTSEGLSDSKGP